MPTYVNSSAFINGVADLLQVANTWTALQTFGNNISFGGATVLVTALALNQILQYNGTNWVNVAASAVGPVSSVFTRTGAVVAVNTDYATAGLSGTSLTGVYNIGGTPTLTATLALGSNTLSGTPTFSGTVAYTAASPFSVSNGQVLTVSVTAQTVGAATLTVPNFASVSDTFAFITLAQTLSNKTIASPVFSGTATGTYTLGGTPTISSTTAFTNSSPFSVANGQTLTVSVTAQTVGAATLTIPNFASVADTFAFITLAQTLSNKTIASPVLSGTATGTYTLGGTPTVSSTLSHTAASPFSVTNGQVLTFSTTAQTVGAATLTIPDFASVSDTLAFITLAQTLSNKTIASPVLSGTATGTYTLGGTPTLSGTFAGTPTFSGTVAFSAASPFSVANGQTLTVSVTSQTVGVATLTIPNFANVSDTFAFITLAQTLSNKTIASPVFSGTATGTYSLGGTPTLSSTLIVSGDFTMTAAGRTFSLKANQSSALQITDGTTGYYTINTQTGTTGAIGNQFNFRAQTLATSAGLTFFAVRILGSSTITLTGTTTVNSLNGLSLRVDNIATLTDASVATVTTASTVYIAGVPTAAGSITITNAFALDVVGAVYIETSFNLGAVSTNNTFSTASTGAGTTTMFIGNGSITVVSDVRLKTQITDTVRNATEIMRSLRIVDFAWNDPSDRAPVNRNTRGRWTGMIAQDVVDQVPWLVNAPDRTCPDCRSGKECALHSGVWQIDFAYMVPLVVKGFQEHETRISKLEKRDR